MKTLSALILAGLLELNGNAIAEKPKFSGTVYGNTYISLADGLKVQGFPFGFGLGLDYGNGRYGVSGDLSYFTQIDYSNERVNSRGVVIEGQTAGSNLTRISLGGRVGNSLTHFGAGFVGVEENNFFRETDRGFFLGKEETDFPNRETYSGVYGEVSAGSELGEIRKRNIGFFIKGTFDYLQNGIKGFMIRTGIRF